MLVPVVVASIVANTAWVAAAKRSAAGGVGVMTTGVSVALLVGVAVGAAVEVSVGVAVTTFARGVLVPVVKAAAVA